MGGIELLLSTKDGKVTDAKLYSDAMDADFIAGIAPALSGCIFRSTDLAKRLRTLPKTEDQQKIVEDIAQYIEQQGY